YEKQIAFYIDFCDEFGIDDLTPSLSYVRKFVSWVFWTTKKPHGVADKLVTAVGFHWKSNGKDWKRENHPAIALQISGYRDLRPSKSNVKKPFGAYHLKAASKYIDMGTYSGYTTWSMSMLAYHWGGRSSEYSRKTYSGSDNIIRRCDVTETGSGSKFGIVIDFKFHKTNRWGIKCGKVEVTCICNGTYNKLCGPCVIRGYLKLRDAKFRGKKYDKEPLFLQFDGRPFLYRHVNNTLDYFCIKIGLDPNDYSSHSFRSGKTVDLVRKGKSDLVIRKWGRWVSDCWKKYYAKLDCSDIASLSKLTLEELGISNH
ncbi:MAG: hypothetical protein NZ748_01035, partial [Candidatus Marinimicrobia bacterium]|nr:hypothetical protein [Candidatus Neomarinimicrobiota bacterium]